MGGEVCDALPRATTGDGVAAAGPATTARASSSGHSNGPSHTDPSGIRPPPFLYSTHRHQRASLARLYAHGTTHQSRGPFPLPNLKDGPLRGLAPNPNPPSLLLPWNLDVERGGNNC